MQDDSPQPSPAAADLDFDTNPMIFLNRELTWLEFNQRVMYQAQDPRIPLLERVKFAAIAGSNMDEFFMKRIGGLKQQLAAGVQGTTVDGRTPHAQIEACYAFVRRYQKEKEGTVRSLWNELEKEAVSLIPYATLKTSEKEQLRNDYFDSIFPLVTPQSIDPAHPFPFISNLSLNLLVTLRYPNEKEHSLARVKVPISGGAPRFMELGNSRRFVLLEKVMAANLDLLFPGMEIVGCEFFRVTRNANTSKREEHADDLLALIESTLKDRKFAPIVRLQVEPGMDPVHRGRLAAELDLDEEADVFEVDGMMGMRDLWQIARLDLPHLKLPPHYPVDHPALLSSRSIFHTIREAGSLLLLHPYESFTSSVERFLDEAAHDPKVRGIKMTLYRTAAHSKIVEHLIHAAENGKQVAVVVELQARFDEEANIRLANHMEEAGIHVTYGIVGLKTHCKVILVLRQDYNGLRRYVHFSTGNYHSETARLYSDIGLLTYDKDLGRDATELFNYLTTGYTPNRNYRKLLPAPKILKKVLLAKIERETQVHTTENPGRLIFKMNALEDPAICRAIYRAAQAGVRVDLIVRDSCRIRPGIPGLSESIRVISIVGRFLEHARIYYFGNGGNEEVYIGSADAMSRNLEHRVEVLLPVEDEKLVKELKSYLQIQLEDQRCVWEMDSDANYRQRRPSESDQLCSQSEQVVRAEKRNKEAGRLRKRQSQNASNRNMR
ncbi:MAG: polyphosphate kinase 1 [Desulfuromonas sp.]|nr:MAG: polyphosphate kinase 1 [Desulfuromonas sp.]